MSLTTALRPVALPFGAGQRRDHSSTDNAQSRPFHHEVSYLNLRRTLARYRQLILLTPSSSDADAHHTSELTALQKQVQAELWSPLPYHRTKWLHNVEGARTLLLQLERKAQAIRVQRAKYEAIKDLAEKRTVIKRLRDRIEEIGREVEMMGPEEWKPPVVEDGGETLYDFLQTQTQSPVTGGPAAKEGAQDAPLTEGKPIKSIEEEQPVGAAQKDKDTREELFGSSSLRQRGKGHGETQKSEAQASGVSTLAGTERSLLDSSRVHEDITTSLVKMAAQLKQEQRKLQFSLEQDKGILGRAIEGLDVSLSGMEAASKNMAFLKRMSEEEGWFGRLKLYGMIFAMWVVAFLLVFVCPKLRFG